MPEEEGEHMLGLNKESTLYTIKAYYYEYVNNSANVQHWKATPKKFYCNYASTKDTERITSTQGLEVTHVTLETNSSINFKRNDKIVLNGLTVLVKEQVLENNPLTAQFTNKPKNYTKFIILE